MRNSHFPEWSKAAGAALLYLVGLPVVAVLGAVTTFRARDRI